jgi:hypothetical protein
MISRGPGFLVVVWFGSSPIPPLLSCQQVVFLSQSSCVFAGRCRESLVLYKSFNTLWTRLANFKWWTNKTYDHKSVYIPAHVSTKVFFLWCSQAQWLSGSQPCNTVSRGLTACHCPIKVQSSIGTYCNISTFNSSGNWNTGGRFL